MTLAHADYLDRTKPDTEFKYVPRDPFSYPSLTEHVIPIIPFPMQHEKLS